MDRSLSFHAKDKCIFISSVDRISQLPDEVLVMILTGVTTEDAVKTSVLSRRWKSVWKHVPYLCFDMRNATVTNYMESLSPHYDRVAKSVTKVLNNHNGHLVGCTIRHHSQQCKDGVLETWVRLLTVKKHIRALAISNLCTSFRKANLLQLSENIFSHPKLETLYLAIYDLKTAHAFNNCHNLMVLKLEKIFAEVDVFNKVIASCPSLKMLVLHVMWYNERACLKIHNDNLKLLHVGSSYVDCIEVFAPLLDIFSIYNIVDTEYNFVIKAPKVLFTKFGAIEGKRIAHMNYNISCHHAQKDKTNFGHEFLVSGDAKYYLWWLKSLAVVVDVMNSTEVEMLREILVEWIGIMGELKIFFKHDNVSKEEGESSIGGTQKEKSEEAKLYPNAYFRVEVMWMFNFNGLNEKQFALASRFVTQGTVMKKMMINTSLIPANKKLDIEAAIVKLMKLPKGNKRLSIESF